MPTEDDLALARRSLLDTVAVSIAVAGAIAAGLDAELAEKLRDGTGARADVVAALDWASAAATVPTLLAAGQ